MNSRSGAPSLAFENLELRDGKIHPAGRVKLSPTDCSITGVRIEQLYGEVAMTRCTKTRR